MGRCRCQGATGEACVGLVGDLGLKITWVLIWRNGGEGSLAAANSKSPESKKLRSKFLESRKLVRQITGYVA